MDKINKKKWLCPFGIESLMLEGNIDSEEFRYVKLAIKGCKLGNECLNDDELSRQAINFLSLN